MNIMAANTINSGANAIITFRFDSDPTGAETFLFSWQNDDNQTRTKTLTGIVNTAKNTIEITDTFETENFTAKNLTTNQTLSLSTLITVKETDDLKFVNEDGAPVCYLPGNGINRETNLIVKTLDNKVWSTALRAFLGTIIYDDSAIGEYDSTTDRTRIEISTYCRTGTDDDGESWTVYPKDIKDESRKFFVEIKNYSTIEKISYSDLVYIPDDIKEKATDFIGLLDLDKLGIN